MRDVVGVVFLVEGDGLLGPSEPCQSSEGVDGICWYLLTCHLF
jgi:hypothetical protein